MGTQESIHAALTISHSIENHCQQISTNNELIKDKRCIIVKLCNGTQSGTRAVKLLDDSSEILKTTNARLLTLSNELKAYASKIQNS